MNGGLNSQREQQWQHILQMTVELQHLSEDENWQAMGDLELRRGALIKEFFSQPVSKAEAEVVAAGIQQILHSDSRILQAGKQQQQQIAADMKKISSGRQAIESYTRIQK